jgi:hypothetical protein
VHPSVFGAFSGGSFRTGSPPYLAPIAASSSTDHCYQDQLGPCLNGWIRKIRQS